MWLLVNRGLCTYKPSVMVVLCISQVCSDGRSTGRCWGSNDYTMVNSCKENIIKGHSTHHGSSGKYYSFVNKSNFTITDNSSISQYVTKPSTNSEKRRKDIENSNILEDMCAK